LCAAAWNTTSGSCRSKDLAQPALVADVGEEFGSALSSDDTTSNSRLSSRSSSSRRAGRYSRSGAPISLPIDPPRR